MCRASITHTMEDVLRLKHQHQNLSEVWTLNQQLFSELQAYINRKLYHYQRTVDHHTTKGGKSWQAYKAKTSLHKSGALKSDLGTHHQKA